MNKKQKKGISLIVLVITIIVILILAGAVILSLSKNNPIKQAEKATFLNDVKNFETELALYEAQQFAYKTGQYDPDLLQADETSVTYNGVIDTSKTIFDLIPSLGRTPKYAGQFKVVDGKLVYQGSDKTRQDWLEETGIDVVVVGEPTVTIIPPSDTLVGIGTDVVYTVKFSSSVAITSVDLTGKVEVLDNSDVALATQPNITIGTVSGTNEDATRQVTVTIKTDTLTNGSYKIKIKPGVVTNASNVSNTTDTISLIGFDIDDTVPTNPTISSNPIGWTSGDVTVTITFSSDSVIKEYSLDSTTWNAYTEPVVVTDNNTTIYARGKDTAGNQSGVATLTILNIDKVAPTITATDGGSTTSSVTITAVSSDVSGSGVNESSYQYSKDNGATWSSSTNSKNYTFNMLTTGTYNCKVKVVDNVGNSATSSEVAITTKPLGTITLAANPSIWTNGSVLVAITYPSEAVTKQYSTNGTTWSPYVSPVIVNTNGITVYAKGADDAGNQFTQVLSTVSNIDKTAPVAVFGTNGGTDIAQVSTTVTLSDAGGSNLVESSLEYIWDTQNVAEPSTGWTTFANGDTITKTGTGTYYLWVRANDNAGNIVLNKTNVFTITN